MTAQFNTPALGEQIAKAIAEREADGDLYTAERFGDLTDPERKV